MKIHFDYSLSGLMVVKLNVFGPKDFFGCDFAIDTGASTTCVDTNILRRVGYDLKTLKSGYSISTASGTEAVKDCKLLSLEGLDLDLTDLPVITYDFPFTLTFGGILGMNVLRQKGKKLIFDFDNQELEWQATL